MMYFNSVVCVETHQLHDALDPWHCLNGHQSVFHLSEWLLLAIIYIHAVLFIMTHNYSSCVYGENRTAINFDCLTFHYTIDICIEPLVGASVYEEQLNETMCIILMNEST